MTDDRADSSWNPSRRGFLLTATAVTSTLAGCSGGGSGNGDGSGDGDATTTTTATTTNSEEVVEMTDDLKFVPESMTVAAGTTVVWENVGSVGHSITAYEDEIPEGADYWASGGLESESDARDEYPSSGDIGGGKTYEHTFETTGTHQYFCIPHETAGMKGEIVVE